MGFARRVLPTSDWFPVMMCTLGSVSCCCLLAAVVTVPSRAEGQRVPVPVAPDSQRTAAGSTAPPPASAAAATPAAPPDYRNLRFDEAWTHLRGGDWSDALKAIPVAPQVTLTLGGQMRAREELAHAFSFSGTSDDYALSRTLIDADLRAGTPKALHGRVFAEFRDAQGFSRDLPGGVRPADADRSDVQNLFADVGCGRSFVRYGRQEVVAGRERLIGVPDWANTRRSLQGARAMLVRGAVAVELMDLRPVTVRQHAVNHADSTTRFRTVSLGSAPGFKAATHLLPSIWQAYHYDQRIAAASATHRVTTGGRLQWTFGSTASRGRSYALETESALQRGTSGVRDIRAWFFTSEASTQWRGVRGTPSLAIGLEAASGDASPTDGRVEAFNVLYAAAHAHGGYADVFGRANARMAQVISTWDPWRRLSLRGALHHYDRLRRSDGVYTKQNTLLRAAGTSSSVHAGDEIDLTANAALSRHLRVIAGHAWIEPGDFLRRSTGGAHSSRWGFVGTTYTF